MHERYFQCILFIFLYFKCYFCNSDAVATHTQSVLLRKVVWRQKWIVKARVLANRVSKGGYRMPIYQKILVFKNCNLSLKNHWNLVVWRCSGGSREGPRGTCHPPPPALIFRPNSGPKGQNNFFLETGAPLWMTTPSPLSQGLYPALSCTYIILVAILLIIGQLIDRFSVSVFPYALILQGTR